MFILTHNRNTDNTDIQPVYYSEDFTQTQKQQTLKSHKYETVNEK